MSLKVEDRDGIWYVVGTVDGRRIRRSTKLPATKEFKRAAQRKLTEISAEAASGVSRRSRFTVGQVLDRWERRVGGIGDSDRAYARKLRRNIGHLEVTPDSASEIQAYFDGQKLAPSSIKREAATLKAAINKVVKDPGQQPQFGVEYEEEERIRYLGDAERERLIRSCDEWLRPLVIFLLYTGARLGEAIRLRPGDVQGGEVILHTRKGGKWKARNVPLHERVEIPAQSPLFQGPRGEPLKRDQVYKAFKKACRRAGISDFTVHDCRHDFATRMRRKGAGLDVLKKLLGHTSYKMVDRYSHLGPSELRGEIERL